MINIHTIDGIQNYRSDSIQLSSPKCFQMRVRKDLEAGPSSVNLHALCPYYYLFGMKIVTLLSCVFF
jgi:hypothetical protein